MFVSLAAALAAAFCYGIGAVMQAIAVRAASRRPVLEAAGVTGGVDPGLIIRMFRQWPFVISLLIDFAGFICQLIALRRLPIFEVQVIIAANLAVTAVFASWLMHTVLSMREWIAVLAVVVGVGLLGSSAGAEGATSVGIDFHLGLISTLVVIAIAGVAAARLPSRSRTPVLGAIAGLGYGVLAVCARILPGFTPHVLIRSPAAYTLAAAGIISFMLYASALESGSVTVATAAVILLETVPPALVGVLFLGDTTRPGLVGPAIVGFFLALVSAVALARFGEAGVEQQSGSPHHDVRAADEDITLETLELAGTAATLGSASVADSERALTTVRWSGPAGPAAPSGSAGSATPSGSAGSATPLGSAGSATHSGAKGAAMPSGVGGVDGADGGGGAGGAGGINGAGGSAGPGGSARSGGSAWPASGSWTPQPVGSEQEEPGIPEAAGDSIRPGDRGVPAVPAGPAEPAEPAGLAGPAERRDPSRLAAAAGRKPAATSTHHGMIGSVGPSGPNGTDEPSGADLSADSGTLGSVGPAGPNGSADSASRRHPSE